MFLKLKDKVDMDEVSKEFENWPDQIINLRVTPSSYLKKPLFDFDIYVTSCFDQLFLKLADKVDMDEISDKFEKLARSDR